MKILAIESSGLVASVAVVEDEHLLAEYTTDYKKTHSQTLLPMIDEMAGMLGLDMNTLDYIAISNGPGSFTGLRIGSATAKGLAFALNIPVVEVSTIEAMAYNYYGTDCIVCPIMDARRNEVYTGVFSFQKTEDLVFEYEMKEIVGPVPLPVSELINRLNEIDKPVIFTGDGIDVYKAMLNEGLTVKHSFGNSRASRQRAASLADLAMVYIKAGKIVSAENSAPVYLRLSQAERELQEKQGKI